MYIHVVYCLEFTTAYSSVGTYVFSRDAASESRGRKPEKKRRHPGKGRRGLRSAGDGCAGFLLEQWCDIEIPKVGNMAVPSHRLQGLRGAASERNLGGGVDVQFMKTVTAACETK